MNENLQNSVPGSLAGEGKNKQAGFTLVEAVLAILLLVTGLGASALTFNMAMRLVSTNSEGMEAMHAARDEVEQLCSLSFNDPRLRPGVYSLKHDEYTGSYEIQSVDDDTKRLTLSIDWESRMSDRAQDASLSTIISKAMH